MRFHDIQQNTEAWDTLRLGKITGSNFGTIMANDGKAFGEPAKAYALHVALERILGRKSDYSFQNAHMERGHDMEEIARMRYAEAAFCEVDNGGFFEDGVFGCSPDGLVGADGLIEIKSVVAKVHYANIQRGTFDTSYRWQLIGNMWATGRKWIDFVSFCSDFPEYAELFTHRTTIDSVSGEVAAMEKRLADFARLVDETEATIRAMSKN